VPQRILKCPLVSETAWEAPSDREAPKTGLPLDASRMVALRMDCAFAEWKVNISIAV